MIQLWKVKREADRVRQQLEAIVGLFWEPFVQSYHDRNRTTKLRVFEGRQSLLPKVAILLIYQPNGLCASTLRTIRYLTKKDYCTMIVANGGISDADLAELEQVAWKVIVRPNYGYDFGGYRDGILSLFAAGIMPEKLMILNDSVWFPIDEGELIVSYIEASELDLGGTIVHRRPRKLPFGRSTTCVIESYFFLFNRKAVNSAAFRKFWVKYRVSSNKYNAVHRGERRVADAMLAAGLSADGVFSAESFLAKIAVCDADFLRKTLMYSSHTRKAYQAESAILLETCDGSDQWRLDAITFITKVVGTSSFHGSFVYAAVKLLSIPFLKKGSGEMQIRMREAYLRAVDAGDLPPPCEDVLTELRDGSSLQGLPKSVEASEKSGAQT